MTVRALMVDVDGVLVRRPDGRRWDADLLADLGIDPADLQDVFFRAHFDDVLAGRADLFERLDQVLPGLGPVTSQELVDYWFTHDATLDTVLLDDLAELRTRGIDLQLATVQEHHRARYLWHDLGLRGRFSAIHYAADIGHRKGEPEFYRAVETRTGMAPRSHCLIDDSPGNVETAREAGWHAVHWTPGLRLADALASLGDATARAGDPEE
ncbi:HAD-IA family hydrolase [Krasilnikoviella flava]|uniref:Putative hydrolase of the HAD superfamily n=1 Tax=Krasilnikoviella flava TaxID=526729 RepID=A0A1T5LIR4_9MICO|nr:HAD-IA family hydrolase [Krasilnikoviella flava]SKC75870.1 putative hydrolase of the HAD superfamily [Krasilnikoviella flava]